MLTGLPVWVLLSAVVFMAAAAVALWALSWKVAVFAPVFLCMGVLSDTPPMGLGAFLGAVLYAAFVAIAVMGRYDAE